MGTAEDGLTGRLLSVGWWQLTMASRFKSSTAGSSAKTLNSSEDVKESSGSHTWYTSCGLILVCVCSCVSDRSRRQNSQARAEEGADRSADGQTEVQEESPASPRLRQPFWCHRDERTGGLWNQQVGQRRARACRSHKHGAAQLPLVLSVIVCWIQGSICVLKV